MSSYPSLIAVTPRTMNMGSKTRPGEIVLNFGKNCRIAIAAKKLNANVGKNKRNSKSERYTHIRYPPKLLQQIPRKESDDGILRCNDLVCSVQVVLFWSMFLIKVALWKALVYEYRARRHGRSLMG